MEFSQISEITISIFLWNSIIHKINIFKPTPSYIKKYITIHLSIRIFKYF